jgi:predicted Na+-dependent transporter
MNKYLGIPIIVAFLLGYKFPFVALDLSKYAFYSLIIMMTLALLSVSLSSFKDLKKVKKEIFFTILTLYIFTPLIQWILCKLLIKDSALFYGTFFASLCPIAIVAPQFTKQHEGNAQLSTITLIISLVLFPFISLFYLSKFTDHAIAIQLKPLFIDMLIVTFLPILIATLINYVIPSSKDKIKKFSFPVNMLLIAFMSFAYFGASMSKLSIAYTPLKEIFSIVLILLIQDFVTYFAAKKFFKIIFSQAETTAIAISISMKNVAMCGAVLLFYDPKASLASALGFLIHALFYSYLLNKNN